MAEIRKNALSQAELVAKEAAHQETRRREQEKTERLYRPPETTTAATYEAKDRAIGEVAKVDGVLWTVQKTSDGTKQWERADGLDFKPVLTVCGSVQGQGQCGGLSWRQGCAGQGVGQGVGQGAGQGAGQGVGQGACVPGRSPFSSGNAACTSPPHQRPVAYSRPGASFSEPLAERPVRLPKVLPAVDAATASEAAAWVQAARLHEQLACADAAAKQRLEHAKQQYYLSIGLLCDADLATVKQRLEAVVHAHAAREFELNEQKEAQCNLEAEIIAAQQVMRDVQQDLEGKHAQGDSFGVQYAAEEFKLAKYKVLLLLKQKRRLKAMVAIHACNVREAAKAKGVAESEFADAMARHEYALQLMRANHDLDDSTQDLIKAVEEKLKNYNGELQKLQGQLEKTRAERVQMETVIRDQEQEQRKALGLSGGQQASGGAAPRRPNQATHGPTAPAGPAGLASSAGSAGSARGGGSDETTGPALGGGGLDDEIKAFEEARKKVNEAFAKKAEQVYMKPDELMKALLPDALDEEKKKLKAEKDAQEKAKKESEEAVEEARKIAQKAIEEAGAKVEAKLQAQEHRNHVTASAQESVLAKMTTAVERNFLGIGDMTNQRGIANGVQYLMSLRFRARRLRDEEAEIRADIARVQQMIEPLQLELNKLQQRLKDEQEKEDAANKEGQPVAQAASAPAVPVAAQVTTTEACDLAPIGTLLNKKRLEAIQNVQKVWENAGVEFTVGMAQGTSSPDLNLCYGRIVKRSNTASAGSGSAGGLSTSASSPPATNAASGGDGCNFEWFYEGALKGDTASPNGLGTFVGVFSDKVHRLRGTWGEGTITEGILETWASLDDAYTNPPEGVHIGTLSTEVKPAASGTSIIEPTNSKGADGIHFERKDKGAGELKQGATVKSENSGPALAIGAKGNIEYTYNDGKHLLFYYLTKGVDSRTAAAYCWQWEDKDADIKSVVVQVGTAVNRPDALTGTVGEGLLNFASMFGMTSATQRATKVGLWNKAVHTGVQCIFINSAGTSMKDQKQLVTGYKDGVTVRTSTGKMLCGLPHGSHAVKYGSGNQFFGQCFNGGPYRGYYVTEEKNDTPGISFWGTFLTPSAPSFDDAWMCFTNTGRRTNKNNPSDVVTQYCRLQVTGEDTEAQRKQATEEAVKGATAADVTGLTTLPPVVFQDYARNNATLCGGAHAAHADGPGAGGLHGGAHANPCHGGTIPNDDGDGGASPRSVGAAGFEGGTEDPAPVPVAEVGTPGAGGIPGGAGPAPAPHAAGVGLGLGLQGGGGDGREWDGGISPAWLQEATRRVDDLCAQLARLRTRALPPSAQGELGARALQYASTFADVLKKKPVCGPGLLRPLARNLAAALDASFAGLENASVMAQLAAWFRLEC